MKLKDCERLCDELNRINYANAVVDKFENGNFALNVFFEFQISNGETVTVDELWMDTDTPTMTSDEIKTMVLRRFDCCVDEILERKEQLIEKITPEDNKYESEGNDPDKWLMSISDRVELTKSEFKKIDTDVRMVLETKGEFEKAMDDFMGKEHLNEGKNNER